MITYQQFPLKASIKLPLADGFLRLNSPNQIQFSITNRSGQPLEISKDVVLAEFYVELADWRPNVPANVPLGLSLNTGEVSGESAKYPSVRIKVQDDVFKLDPDKTFNFEVGQVTPTTLAPINAFLKLSTEMGQNAYLVQQVFEVKNRPAEGYELSNFFAINWQKLNEPAPPLPIAGGDSSLQAFLPLYKSTTKYPNTLSLTLTNISGKTITLGKGAEIELKDNNSFEIVSNNDSDVHLNGQALLSNLNASNDWSIQNLPSGQRGRIFTVVKAHALKPLERIQITFNNSCIPASCSEKTGRLELSIRNVAFTSAEQSYPCFDREDVLMLRVADVPGPELHLSLAPDEKGIDSSSMCFSIKGSIRFMYKVYWAKDLRAYYQCKGEAPCELKLATDPNSNSFQFNPYLAGENGQGLNLVGKNTILFSLEATGLNGEKARTERSVVFDFLQPTIEIIPPHTVSGDMIRPHTVIGWKILNAREVLLTQTTGEKTSHPVSAQGSMRWDKDTPNKDGYQLEAYPLDSNTPVVKKLQ